jgi:hypothetical protein
MTFVRQRYVCDEEQVFVEYNFNQVGLIVSMKEIEVLFDDSPNMVMPKVEVTPRCFEQIKKKIRRW